MLSLGEKFVRYLLGTRIHEAEQVGAPHVFIQFLRVQAIGIVYTCVMDIEPR